MASKTLLGLCALVTSPHKTSFTRPSAQTHNPCAPQPGHKTWQMPSDALLGLIHKYNAWFTSPQHPTELSKSTPNRRPPTCRWKRHRFQTRAASNAPRPKNISEESANWFVKCIDLLFGCQYFVSKYVALPGPNHGGVLSTAYSVLSTRTSALTNSRPTKTKSPGRAIGHCTACEGHRPTGARGPAATKCRRPNGVLGTSC